MPPATISAQRLSPLTILESYPTAAFPFSTYLSMLPPMRIRQYSISSSPLPSPTSCTLTYAVVNAPAPPSVPADKQHHNLGVATTYLASLSKDDKLLISVRPSHTAFHPPLDIANIPVIMLCAGTGLAPFRGFVQERASQLAAGRTLAPALLFIGCRYPDKDALYADELRSWAKEGAVDVRYAFSKAPEKSEGCKYVQDRLYKDRAEAEALWEKGAKMYVCGSGEAGEGIRACVVRIAIESARRSGTEPEDGRKERVEEWFKSIRNERFASDVFA